MKTSSIWFCIVLFITLFVNSVMLLAQPGDPGDPGDNPVPITGVEILLLSGGALGGYKIYKNKVRKNKI